MGVKKCKSLVTIMRPIWVSCKLCVKIRSAVLPRNLEKRVIRIVRYFSGPGLAYLFDVKPRTR